MALRGDSGGCERKGEIITAAVVWLLLGAIVNVAVAWGLAICFDFSSVIETAPPTDSLVLKAFPDIASMPHGKILRGRRTRLGLAYEDVTAQTNRWYAHLETGYPFLAMQGTQHVQSPPVIGKRLAQSMIVITQPDGGFMKRRALPLLPMWPGFAINTAIYALLLWLLFTVPHALRRKRRVRRGQCPACAYPLRGAAADICTECGTALGVRR